MKIYLAGGTHGDWRDKVVEALVGTTAVTLSPKDNGGGTLHEQKTWDLLAVVNSDIVLAYFEPTNPSGVGTALEVGYALGLGIPVIVVNESPIKYIKFVEEAATLTYPSLDEAIAELLKLINIY